MALIIEDGSIVEGANSYVSEAEADTYFEDMGTSWDGMTSAEKQRSLIKACKAMEQLFGELFISFPKDPNQRLLHPRLGTYDMFGRWRREDVVMQEVKDAQCELALMYFDDPESIYPEEDNTSSIRQYNVQVGDISRSIAYGGEVRASKFQGLRSVEQILKPILSDGTNNVQFSL